MAMCSCGLGAVIRTSWTDYNPGRRFYSCPNPGAPCRGFLGWIDPPMCPRAVQIIPGLLRSKNRAEKERDELRAKIRLKNTVIVVLLLVLGLPYIW